MHNVLIGTAISAVNRNDPSMTAFLVRADGTVPCSELQVSCSVPLTARLAFDEIMGVRNSHLWTHMEQIGAFDHGNGVLILYHMCIPEPIAVRDGLRWATFDELTNEYTRDLYGEAVRYRK